MSKYISLYERITPSDPIAKNDPRRPAIIKEMQGVLKAKTDAEAVEVIAWWHAWPNPRHLSALEFVQEARSIGLADQKEAPAESELSEYHQKILAVLDADGGFTTGDAANLITLQFGDVYGHNARTHSGAVRSWLLQLEKAGLVRRLDDQKPVCWVKVRKAGG